MIDLIYLVWCDGREFGIDYDSREAALAVARDFKRNFPSHHYRVSCRRVVR